MANGTSQKNLLGINGFGRIGKLSFWNHLNIDHFDGYVINVGRKVGKSLEDLLDFVSIDSTYGSLDRFLYGYSGQKCDIKVEDEANYIVSFNGKTVKFLTENRNPKDVNWSAEGVKLVVDCTGVFLDPTVAADAPKGSVRGHLEGGAEKVICSAPFKIGDSSLDYPEDSAMFVYGINHLEYDRNKHNIISSASCTTTALSHMMKPLVDTLETSQIVTASMSTVHSATNNQSIIDSMPGANTADLRRNRSAFNNIILTSTGAAKALERVLPEIKEVGFMADSVRVPINTVSLIALNLTFKTELNDKGEPIITREYLNNLYAKAADGPQKDLLVYSDKQNVSSDIRGMQATCVIEGHDTHTRTGFINIPQNILKDSGIKEDVKLPVTHAKILGWYDNEFGNYVYALGKLTVYINKNMI